VVVEVLYALIVANSSARRAGNNWRSLEIQKVSQVISTQNWRKVGALEAVIVDLDGTMVDTMGDFEAALNLMLAELTLPGIGRTLIEQLVGKGSEHLIRSVLTQVMAVGDTQAQSVVIDQCIPDAWASYQRHYLAINGSRSEVYPGVVEGLTHLRTRGLKLACLTNKPTAFAKPLLEAKGLMGYFDWVFGGDAFERKKPDPLPLLKTCEVLGVMPARTLMLGDSSNDAQAARAAGCPVVLVTYGYNHGDPVLQVDADAWIDRLDDFLGLI
jgi:phosphoglycolate phosphatase